ATSVIYTLSLHDALPISNRGRMPRGGFEYGGNAVAVPSECGHLTTPSQGWGHLPRGPCHDVDFGCRRSEQPARVLIRRPRPLARDRKSTRLNSSHDQISY